MPRDKIEEALLEALKQGLAEPGEQRLFKSGKLAGLFPGRTGANADAAARALRDGLLEVVRTETKGKTSIDWVKLTPRGVQFVHECESPVEVLKELRTVLQTTREGVPLWLEQLKQEVNALGSRLAQDVERVRHRLDAVSQRVEEALRRADILTPPLGDEMQALVPWGQHALDYLDHRRSAGAAGDCPLPELFTAVRAKQGDLTVTGFHDGLRRLQERRALRLLPFNQPGQPLPQPEYALLDGAAVLYFAAR